MFTFIFLALSSVIAGFAYVVATSDLWRPLSGIPGPLFARVTSLWELQAFRGSKDYISIVRDLHKKYGKVVRLAPGRYSISDPQAAKEIYHHGTKFIKGAFYHGFSTATSDEKVFVDRDAARHAKNRRNIASLYSMSTLRSYEPFVDDVSSLFRERLTDFARSGASICLPDWMQYYAFDVIGMMTFSNTFGLLESGKDHLGVLDLLFNLNHFVPALGIAAPGWLIRLSKVWMSLPIPSAAGAMNRWVGERVQSRSVSVNSQKERADLRSDFAEKTLALQETGKLTQQARFNVVSQNIVAGSDTTGVTLGAAAWFLATHPTALSRLREELAERTRDGRLSSPVTFAEANDMPYLQAVIRESLRMHPAVGMILEREVPAGGVVLCGHHFPAGTRVGASAWQLNFDGDTWGPDAHDFRPERWLQDPEAARKLDAALFSFGAGSRTCLGRNISLLEMSKLLPELYRRFDFELVSPRRDIDATWFVYHRFDVRVKELEKSI